jgi:hypothetical protein
VKMLQPRNSEFRRQRFGAANFATAHRADGFGFPGTYFRLRAMSCATRDASSLLADESADYTCSDVMRVGGQSAMLRGTKPLGARCRFYADNKKPRPFRPGLTRTASFSTLR